MNIKQLDVRENKKRRKFSWKYREWMWLKQGGMCIYYDLKMDDVMDTEVDHMLPFSQGGSNHNKNLCLVHKECNRVKRDFYDEDFQKVKDYVKSKLSVLSMLQENVSTDPSVDEILFIDMQAKMELEKAESFRKSERLLQDKYSKRAN